MARQDLKGIREKKLSIIGVSLVSQGQPVIPAELGESPLILIDDQNECLSVMNAFLDPLFDQDSDLFQLPF